MITRLTKVDTVRTHSSAVDYSFGISAFQAGYANEFVRESDAYEDRTRMNTDGLNCQQSISSNQTSVFGFYPMRGRFDIV